MERFARILTVALALSLTPGAALAQEPPVTTTTIAGDGGALGDDFLTLYPQYGQNDHLYLDPGSNALPVTGQGPAAAFPALALVVAGFVTSRRSRRARHQR